MCARAPWRDLVWRVELFLNSLQLGAHLFVIRGARPETGHNECCRILLQTYSNFQRLHLLCVQEIGLYLLRVHYISFALHSFHQICCALKRSDLLCDDQIRLAVYMHSIIIRCAVRSSHQICFRSCHQLCIDRIRFAAHSLDQNLLCVHDLDVRLHLQCFSQISGNVHAHAMHVQRSK